MGSPERRRSTDQKTQLSAGAGVLRPAGSESKQGPRTTARSQSQAESLVAAEKRTLEMIADGASLPEVLNNLCAAIDAHAPRAASMVCLMDPDGKQLLPSAGLGVPAQFAAAIMAVWAARTKRLPWPGSSPPMTAAL